MAKIKNEIVDIIENYQKYNIFPQKRILYLASEIDIESGDEFGVGFSMSNMFIRNLNVLEYISLDPITILLNTEGGDVAQGFAIYDAIKKSECHVTIKVIGTCMSMGSVILQAADERVASANSSFMIHDGSSFSGGNSYESENMAKFNSEMSRRADSIVYKAINNKRSLDKKPPLSRKTFDSLLLKSSWMFSERALELGLIDKIE